MKRSHLICLLVVLIALAGCQSSIDSSNVAPSGNGDSSRDPLPNEEPSLQFADEILARLSQGSIAFTTPSEMRLDESQEIELLLSLEKTVEELAQDIQTGPDFSTAEIKISNRMIASLKGDGFQITELTSSRQAITATENTRWVWLVKPEEAGKKYLYLTLSAVISIEGESFERTIQTFNREIVVTVTPVQRVGRFFGQYWEFILGTLVIPAGLFLWGQLRGKKTV